LSGATPLLVRAHGRTGCCGYNGPGLVHTQAQKQVLARLWARAWVPTLRQQETQTRRRRLRRGTNSYSNSSSSSGFYGSSSGGEVCLSPSLPPLLQRLPPHAVAPLLLLVLPLLLLRTPTPTPEQRLPIPPPLLLLLLLLEAMPVQVISPLTLCASSLLLLPVTPAPAAWA
jgi:hypothetical protein